MRLLPLKRIRMVILQDKNQPAKEEEYYVHDVYEYAAIFMVCVWIGWRVVFVGGFRFVWRACVGMCLYGGVGCAVLLTLVRRTR